MRALRPLLALLIASTSLTACLSEEGEDQGDEDLGDIGDGKSDSFGIVDKSTYVYAGKTRNYTFSANAAFRLAITQPSSAEDMPLDVYVTAPDGTKVEAPAGTEPQAVHDPADFGGPGTYTLTIRTQAKSARRCSSTSVRSEVSVTCRTRTRRRTRTCRGSRLRCRRGLRRTSSSTTRAAATRAPARIRRSRARAA
jgi:hypothetical protein